jgi:hypothetical protein
MTILNSANEGIPAELIALFRVVAHSKKISREDLLVFCIKGDVTPDTSKRFIGALKIWEKIGLFEGKQIININPKYIPSGRVKVDLLTENLPDIARKLLMEEKNCLPLWDNTNDSENETGNGPAADFIRGLSWALSQNIYSFPKTWLGDMENLANQQIINKNKKVFSSDLRFNAFRRWSRYLGFATGDSNTFQIDPTVAVRGALPKIFESRDEMPAVEFLKKLNTQLPVLDSGSFRKKIEAELDPNAWKITPEGHLSTSLSFALKRLQMSKVIKLNARADAGNSLRLIGMEDKDWGGFVSVAKGSAFKNRGLR